MDDTVSSTGYLGSSSSSSDTFSSEENVVAAANTRAINESFPVHARQAEVTNFDVSFLVTIQLFL